MRTEKTELIVVAGSAGSLSVLLHLIRTLPEDFDLPVIIVVHRQRNVSSDLTRILAEANRNRKILEPDDKEPVERGGIYVAPQNYHLLIEKERTFSLDYSEAVKFSRPSIDVTLKSAANVYGKSLLAILLSGANNDGTEGLKAVVSYGGMAVAQDPATADFPAMPRYAIAAVPDARVLDADGMRTLMQQTYIK